MVEQEESSYTPSEEGIQYENCFTLSDKQPSNAGTTALPSPLLHQASTDKGHFILLDLKSSDSCHSTQIHTTPHSYNIDTGNVILRSNRAQLRPAAPPRNMPLQSPPLPSPQPFLPGTPARSATRCSLPSS